MGAMEGVIKMKTLKELAQESLDVQNACNLTGVAHGMARAIGELRDVLGNWDEANVHPIALLWVDKLAQLTGYAQDYQSNHYKQVFQILES